jgi:hypothetical protein
MLSTMGGRYCRVGHLVSGAVVLVAPRRTEAHVLEHRDSNVMVPRELQSCLAAADPGGLGAMDFSSPLPEPLGDGGVTHAYLRYFLRFAALRFGESVRHLQCTPRGSSSYRLRYKMGGRNVVDACGRPGTI